MPPADKTTDAAAPETEADAAPETQAEAAPEAPVVVAEPAPLEVTLAEFCSSAAANGHGPEMLGGFHHDETVKGSVKATAEAFAARLEAFANRPV